MTKKIFAGQLTDHEWAAEARENVLCGADGVVFIDLSDNDADHDRFMERLRSFRTFSDVPVISGGRIKRMEDVKKYIYAGSDAVYLDASVPGNMDLLKEASTRFGKNRIWLYLNASSQFSFLARECTELISALLIDTDTIPLAEISLPDYFSGETMLTCTDQKTEMEAFLKLPYCDQIMVMKEQNTVDYRDRKEKLAKEGIAVSIPAAAFQWSEIKTDEKGLLPVVVQDYKNNEVLMAAYMNEEAFLKTLALGRMTYYSRSRQKLWIKGETSGHFQFVKSLTLDCDKDTLLAKVFQVGAACHTGNRSCFFQTVLSSEIEEKKPEDILETVYGVIQDRLTHPKEGSYTNYLFDKGIDKILKKLGEEATETVIAAKNTDRSEIVYEISDLLYHLMVLMVQKDIDWNDISDELMRRETSSEKEKLK